MDLEILKMFRIIVVEFHSLDQVWNRQFFEITRQVFAKLCMEHECVHIHPNNCCGVSKIEGLEIPIVAEFTFYRKDRMFTGEYATNLTHDEDYPNTAKEVIELSSSLFDGD